MWITLPTAKTPTTPKSQRITKIAAIVYNIRHT
jgi:hypothetical protein